MYELPLFSEVIQKLIYACVQVTVHILQGLKNEMPVFV